MSNNCDRASLLDIVRAAQKVLQYKSNTDKIAFLADDKTQSAILTQRSPKSIDSKPAIIFSSVDLPEPFVPMSPTLSSSSRLKLASVKSSLMPKSFLIDRRVKIVICIESHLPDLV
jgi:hypothetical protein